MGTRASHPGLQFNSRTRADIAFFVLLALAAAFIFWDLHRPFNQTDEFLYSTVAQNMLDSGDFVTPRFAHIDLYTKPPLYFWLSAAILGATDDLQLSIRLIPGLSLLALMALLFVIGKRYFDPTVGLTSAAILFLCYDHLFNHAYKAGVMEGLLNFFIASAVFLNATLIRSPGNIRWIAMFVGLAFLTKSVFAVIPAGLTAINLLSNRRSISIERKYWLQAVGGMAIVILPWFVVAVSAHGTRVLEYMFVDQVWKRAVNDGPAAAATGRSFGRPQSFYVLRHFLEYGQPWSLLVWPALVHAWRCCRDGRPESRILLRLSVIWFVGVMALFLISRGRWSWYISSVYIPAALVIAVMLKDFVRYPGACVAPYVWVAVIVAGLVSATQYVFNPYATSSGGFPLRMDLFRQLLVVGLIGLVTAAVWRRNTCSCAPRVGFLIRGIVVTTIVGIIAAYVYFARAPHQAVMLPFWIIVGFIPIGLGLIGLLLMRDARQARIAAVACIFIIASGYLAASLHWSRGANERQEIVWVRGAISRGMLDSQSPLTIAPASLFSFIPIYATFRNDFLVEYDAKTKTISMTRE